MPTSITQPICDGDITFQDFALRAARMIGFLGQLKDEPLDMPLPETIDPNPYYGTEYANAQVFLQAIETMSDATAERRAQADYLVALQHYQLKLAAVRERRSRCEAMLAEVQAWQPPTSEHDTLKLLMTQQLEECIAVDCNTKYLNKPELLSGADYKQKQLEAARRRLNYAEKNLNEEIERASRITAWLTELRNSLNKPSTPV